MGSSTFRTCSSLPDDTLIEIFACLPLNSIYKFRCLSKVWFCNLSDPSFITKWFHINNKSLPWIQYHLINGNPDGRNPLQFRNAYPESHSEFMSKHEHLFSFKFLINDKTWRLYPLGSSNGLVLCRSVYSDDQRNRYHVCNPLTQKWVSLPSLPSQDSPLDVTGIFCENSPSFTSSYKVVHMSKFGEPSKKFIVDIFSSDLGVWESIEVSCDEDVKWRGSYFNNVVILNGVFFWIEGGNRMLAYNLNQKNKGDGHRCSLIHLPDKEFDDYSRGNTIFGESEGWVCCTRTRWLARGSTVSVWVLDEFNWKILHKDISTDDILAEACSRIGDQVVMVQLLGFSPPDRNVVFIGLNNWVWVFNIQTRSVEVFCLDNKHGYNAGVMYLPFVLKPLPTVLPPPSSIDT